MIQVTLFRAIIKIAMKGDCGFQASKSMQKHHKNSPYKSCATNFDIHLMKELERSDLWTFVFKFGFVQWISWSGSSSNCIKSYWFGSWIQLNDSSQWQMIKISVCSLHNAIMWFQKTLNIVPEMYGPLLWYTYDDFTYFLQFKGLFHLNVLLQNDYQITKYVVFGTKLILGWTNLLKVSVPICCNWLTSSSNSFHERKKVLWVWKGMKVSE